MAEESSSLPTSSTFLSKVLIARIKRAIARCRGIDREAAIDSVRSVFAMIGVGSVLAYMGTMPPYLVPVALVMIAGAWYFDYLRHF